MDFELTTATGKTYPAHRCYISDMDGVLNIGIADISLGEAASVFSLASETEHLSCEHLESHEVQEFYGYTSLTLITVQSNINGVYIVLRKP